MILFPFPTNVGSHNPLLVSHTARCLTLIPTAQTTTSKYYPLWSVTSPQPHGFKTCLLRSFRTHNRNRNGTHKTIIIIFEERGIYIFMLWSSYNIALAELVLCTNIISYHLAFSLLLTPAAIFTAFWNFSSSFYSQTTNCYNQQKNFETPQETIP